MIWSRIVGTGSYLPPNCVTNEELAKRIETSDEWIRSRTGITQRYIADPSQGSSDLGAEAARAALASAGVAAADIDLIVVATSTPDYIFPSAACLIQNKIGAKGCPAFDVQAVCSGFVYAMTIADKFIRSGSTRSALVIGSEVFSRILDWNDRTTCVLFGDGAGAVVLEAQAQTGTREDRGIIATRIRSDGRYEDLLYVDGGPGSTRTTGHLRMNGREVFRHAVNKISGVIEETLAESGYKADEIDLFVPHQANARILDGIAKKLKVSPEKIVMTLSQHGNTSAASIPLALNQAFEQGRIDKGSLVLMEAMGGGFTWGAVLARW